jgi:cytochrome c-type biogenesis protein CcmF
MDEIQYIGEHLLPGQIGQFTIVLSFVASMFAAITYYFAEQRKESAEASGWLKMGRIGYLVHGLSIFTTIACIFYVMYFRMYEYQYAQLHVSDDLEMKYILSAFWEGQEGSFLLWMFWHVILGFILIRVAKNWEAPVMSMLSLVQFFISSMILGVYVFETKIGANPLMMLRDTMDIPLFAQADYVELLSGNGLNPLLQNYWMTIHPPTLFLGFASTTIPFCFAIAGLWNGKHKEMLQVSFPWALFSGAILGTGILMGGAWAYEALTFGGYWAWDPVENASLVPWILIVAGIHTHLVARATGHSIRSTYLFYIMTFFFILYSTFLTRSGVLGETSVHAFTEMGLEGQLLIFTSFFLIVPLVIFFAKQKSIPSIEKEEALASKEFWMFIGSLVLLFSACLITASTSLPVYNKIAELFNPGFEGYVIQDQVAHHNKYQLWIGVFIGLLTGAAQFFRFREANWGVVSKKYFTHLAVTLVIAAALTFAATQWINAYAWQYQLLLFAGIFSVVSNLDYLTTFIRGNMKVAGSVISHVGFGLLIVGVLASGLNKEHISTDPFTQRDLLNEEMLKRNVILFKGKPALLNGYEITYQRDSMVDLDRLRTYDINFKKLNKAGKVVEEFTVYPTAQFDNKLVKVAAYNPDTKHYLDKDIFTHVVTLPKKEADREEAQKMEDSLNYRIIEVPLGTEMTFIDTFLVLTDTMMINRFLVSIESIIPNATHPDYEPKEKDLSIGAKIKIQQLGKPEIYEANPVAVLRNNLIYTYPIQINDLAFKIKLPTSFFDQVFATEINLDYQNFELEEGGAINFNGYKVQLERVARDPKHPNYEPEKDDIAVGAILKVTKNGSTKSEFVQPIYLIRKMNPMMIKDKLAANGLNFQFTKIDPTTGKMSIGIAQSEANMSYPVEFATNSLRTDYIVFEAIIFPGINFFWAGSIMMMIGLTMSWIRRRFELKR